MKKKKKSKLISTIFLFILACFMLWLAIDAPRYDNIKPKYQTLQTMQSELKSGTVYALYVTDKHTVNYQLKSDISAENLEKDPSKVSIFDLDSSKWYYTNYSEFDAFYELALNNNTPVLKNKFTPVSYKALSVIVSLLPSLILLGLLLSLIIVTAGTGRSGKKYTLCSTSDYKFSDVIGQDEVIDDIKTYINILKNSSSFAAQGLRPPKGVLFSGAPGTGKTLLAKAMAGEAKLPFIYLNASNCIEMFAGVGAKTVRSCFKTAKSLAPCIIFIDELDAIGNKRGTYHGSSEDNQTLLQLLQELDGFDERTGILVIAATNASDGLDPALKRAGRFDREVKINPPRDKSVRLELLKHYTEKLKLASDVNLEAIAAQLTGMTGADIATICNEAAILAISDDKIQEISADNFAQAIDKLLLKGNKLKNKKLISDTDKKITAYHEAGHAVMCFLTNTPISRITIQGTTSGVGGFVMQADTESQYMTASELESKIKIAYAGRESECIKFGKTAITTGASSDISQATQYLLRYIGSYGFSPDFGYLDLKIMSENQLVDKQAISNNLKKLSDKLASETNRVLSENFSLVEKLALALLEKETMTAEEVYAILA